MSSLEIDYIMLSVDISHRGDHAVGCLRQDVLINQGFVAFNIAELNVTTPIHDAPYIHRHRRAGSVHQRVHSISVRFPSVWKRKVHFLEEIYSFGVHDTVRIGLTIKIASSWGRVEREVMRIRGRVQAVGK
jgi:hypothetical protein